MVAGLLRRAAAEPGQEEHGNVGRRAIEEHLHMTATQLHEVEAMVGKELREAMATLHHDVQKKMLTTQDVRQIVGEELGQLLAMPTEDLRGMLSDQVVQGQ